MIHSHVTTNECLNVHLFMFKQSIYKVVISYCHLPCIRIYLPNVTSIMGLHCPTYRFSPFLFPLMQLNTLAYPLTHAMNLDLDTQFTPLSFDVKFVSWWNVKDSFNKLVVSLAFKQFLITSSLPNQVTQYDLPILKVNDYGCPPFSS